MSEQRGYIESISVKERACVVADGDDFRPPFAQELCRIGSDVPKALDNNSRSFYLDSFIGRCRLRYDRYAATGSGFATERARARRGSNAIERAPEYHAFVQFVLDRQWSRLRRHALERGIRLVGDLPIFWRKSDHRGSSWSLEKKISDSSSAKAPEPRSLNSASIAANASSRSPSGKKSYALRVTRASSIGW